MLRCRRPMGERGAILLMAVFFAVFGIALLYTTYGMAETVLFRERLQDAADAAALSSAVSYARSMNLLVLLNIVMAVLLAILVTLKLIEALAIIGIVIAAALAWPTFGGSLAAIPPLKMVQQDVRAAYDQVKPPIDTALEILHDTADAVKEGAPAAASAIGADRVELSKPVVKSGVVAPVRDSLPVEDDEYSTLCGEAGAIPGKLAQSALEGIDAPFLPEVMGELSRGMETLARRFSDWFCGDGGSGPPSFPRKARRHLPRMEWAAACEDEELRVADPSASRAAKTTTPACQKAAALERQSTPDEAGACKAGNDCSLEGPYEQRAARARIECKPTRSPRPLEYLYLQRSGAVQYVWTRAGWRRGEARFDTADLKTRKRPPCGSWRVVPEVAEGYNLTVRRGDDVGEVLPVCTTETPPPFFGVDEGQTFTMPFTEVTHVFGCTIEETIEISVEDGETGGDGGDERAPKRLEAKVGLGDGNFQLRAVVAGDLATHQAGRMVRLALWNRPEPEDPLAKLAELRGYAVAQAEYFYDGADGRDAWMWNMRWRARLRRFRVSDDAALDALHKAAGALQTETAGSFIDRLVQLEAWVTH